MKKDSIWIEKPNAHNEYGFRLDNVDEDGFNFVETKELDDLNCVYCYYSELPVLIPILQERYKQWKKCIK